MLAVRHGDFDQVAPDLFSDEWPRPIVANRIDVMARHAAAALSPLPLVSCQSGTSASERSRAFADKRTKIANHYLTRSRVQAQMQRGADQFYTFGMIVTSVEPDVDNKFPDILIEDSIGVYPAWNRRGETVEVARVFRRNVLELCAEFPELADKILAAINQNPFEKVPPSKDVEVVKYVSAKQIIMYLPKDGNLVLLDTPNPLGRCTYVVTQKPGLDGEIRGAFDDLIYVQLALHAMQVYTLSASATAVEAPLVVPNDVGDVPTGPGAVIRTSDPSGVRRVPLDVPQGAFASSQYLAQELQYGAITPEALGGSIDASVVTGKGVQQLMAGYSQQIANCQQSLVGHFEMVLSLALEMDEKFWPNVEKSIQGRAESTPYKLTYTPAKDIAGDYTVDVQYGGVAGLDPNRGLVFLLQALGGDLVSRDYVRRNIPSSLNPDDEEKKITQEKLRASLLESLSAYAQSIPALAANGGDPSEIIARTIGVIEKVSKGEALETAMGEAFPPPKPVQTPDMTGMPENVNGQQASGFQENGLPNGLQMGAASRGQGGRPDLSMLFAGLNSNGSPNLQAGVSRQIPAGGGA